jgi:hypothetical protein
MCIQTSKNTSHLKQQKSLNEQSNVKMGKREMNNFLVSNVNKRNIKLSRVKSKEENAESVSIKETLRVILRDGFQYFGAG